MFAWNLFQVTRWLSKKSRRLQFFPGIWHPGPCLAPFRFHDCLKLYSSSLQLWSMHTEKKIHFCQCRQCKRGGFNPWVRKTLWYRKWQPTPCLGNPMDKRAWQTTVHRVAKSQTQLGAHTHTHTHTHTHWGFPGCPVVKTPCFHCREHGFDPWSGN